MAKGVIPFQAPLDCAIRPTGCCDELISSFWCQGLQELLCCFSGIHNFGISQFWSYVDPGCCYFSLASSCLRQMPFIGLHYRGASIDTLFITSFYCFDRGQNFHGDFMMICRDGGKLYSTCHRHDLFEP